MQVNSSQLERPAGAEESKRARVLEGAVQVFLTYGFQRTTMDDIARAAEMSRPALYLLFRNKTDIYRAIADSMFERSAELARRALEGKGTLAQRIETALEDCVFSMIETYLNAPHGAEILDMKGSLAGDIAAKGRGTLSALVSGAIAAEAAARRADLAARGLSAEILAALLLDCVDGGKSRAASAAEMRATTGGMVKLIDLALQPASD